MHVTGLGVATCTQQPWASSAQACVTPHGICVFTAPCVPATDPKILLLNIELELKSEKENAEVRLDDPAKYQSIVDAEWNIIYGKLAECANSGAQIVLSR